MNDENNNSISFCLELSTESDLRLDLLYKIGRILTLRAAVHPPENQSEISATDGGRFE